MFSYWEVIKLHFSSLTYQVVSNMFIASLSRNLQFWRHQKNTNTWDSSIVTWSFSHKNGNMMKSRFFLPSIQEHIANKTPKTRERNDDVMSLHTKLIIVTVTSPTKWSYISWIHTINIRKFSNIHWKNMYVIIIRKISHAFNVLALKGRELVICQETLQCSNLIVHEDECYMCYFAI